MLMTPWVQRLLAVNVIVHLLAQLPSLDFGGHFALAPAELLQRPWTIVTYMFLHGGFMHLASNMISLFFFGPRLEERLGSRRFLVLYFLCGICGALLSLVLFAVAPFESMVGASGAVFGVLVGFARYWPDDAIYIMGVLPVRARTLAIVLIAASLFAGATGVGGNIAHFAHLGGGLAGWAYLVAWERQRIALIKEIAGAPRKSSERRAPQARRKPQAAREADSLERWKAIPRDRLHELNREELETLLRKAEEGGVKALTAAERAFLDRIADATQPAT